MKESLETLTVWIRCMHPFSVGRKGAVNIWSADLIVSNIWKKDRSCSQLLFKHAPQVFQCVFIEKTHIELYGSSSCRDLSSLPPRFLLASTIIYKRKKNKTKKQPIKQNLVHPTPQQVFFFLPDAVCLWLLRCWGSQTLPLADRGALLQMEG